MHAADQSAVRIVEDPLFEVHDGALFRSFVFDTEDFVFPTDRRRRLQRPFEDHPLFSVENLEEIDPEGGVVQPHARKDEHRRLGRKDPQVLLVHIRQLDGIDRIRTHTYAQGVKNGIFRIVLLRDRREFPVNQRIQIHSVVLQCRFVPLAGAHCSRRQGFETLPKTLGVTTIRPCQLTPIRATGYGGWQCRFSKEKSSWSLARATASAPRSRNWPPNAVRKSSSTTWGHRPSERERTRGRRRRCARRSERPAAPLCRAFTASPPGTVRTPSSRTR